MGAPEHQSVQGGAANTAALTAENKGDVLVVHVKGRLDSISSPFAEKMVCESIEQGHLKIVLEISGVNYVSSAGMRMLLAATKKMRSLSGKFFVTAVTPNVMDVLKMSGFDHILELYNTEDEALKHF